MAPCCAANRSAPFGIDGVGKLGCSTSIARLTLRATTLLNSPLVASRVGPRLTGRVLPPADLLVPVRMARWRRPSRLNLEELGGHRKSGALGKETSLL